MLIKTVRTTKARGGCPPGSLGGQLAESDPEARALIAAGFEEWSCAISDGLRALSAAGQLRAGIDPGDLASPSSPRCREACSSPSYSAAPASLERAVGTVLGLASGS